MLSLYINLVPITGDPEEMRQKQDEWRSLWQPLMRLTDQRPSYPILAWCMECRPQVSKDYNRDKSMMERSMFKFLLALEVPP